MKSDIFLEYNRVPFDGTVLKCSQVREINESSIESMKWIATSSCLLQIYCAIMNSKFFNRTQNLKNEKKIGEYDL